MSSYSTYPFGDFHWKEPVDTLVDLPPSGNSVGDARVTEDTATIYVWDGSAWIPSGGGGGGGGTVTSVALALPASVFIVTGSPVTTSGTLTGSFSNQSANTILAGPTSGGASTPAFRSVVPADIPTLNQNTTGTASNVTGIVAIANGGTNSSAALNNSRVIVSSAGAIVEHSAITANRALASNAGGLPIAAATTSLELDFVSGVTSPIQSQIDNKQATGNYITALTGDVTATGPGSVAATIANLAVTNAKIANATIDLAAKVSGVLPVANGGTNSSSTLNNNRVIQSSGGAVVEAAAITASRALVSDANGIPVAATPTTTEVNFVSGVTSAIQTQINTKATALAIVSVTGDVTLTTNAIHLVSSAAARNLTLPAHVAGQILYIKDSTGSASTNNFTLIRTGGGNIDGIAASRTLQTNWGSWMLVDDGTNWYVL